MTTDEAKAYVVAKFISGRYFLTVIGGITFAYAVYKAILSAEAIATILTTIFMSYFQMDRVNHKEEK